MKCAIHRVSKKCQHMTMKVIILAYLERNKDQRKTLKKSANFFWVINAIKEMKMI
jgi:hypothetical protein